jgi:hypothetical protein
VRLITGFLLVVWAATSLAGDIDDLMQRFTWQHRVLLVFAPQADHAALRQQNEYLEQVTGGLLERDMVVLRSIAGNQLSVDRAPSTIPGAALNRRYAVANDQFRVILVGKDGTVKLEQFEPVTPETLFALIDRMPMRRQEMLR